MDSLIEPALYMLMGLGACAGAYVLDWLLDKWADAFDSWAESISTHYLDDL